MHPFPCPSLHSPTRWRGCAGLLEPLRVLMSGAKLVTQVHAPRGGREKGAGEKEAMAARIISETNPLFRNPFV